MEHFGRVKPGSVLYGYFTTYDGGTGASLTMTGLAVGDILIYKDGGMVQRASTAGFTLLDTDGIDIDTVTGLHGFSIDLADNTTANFYEAGSHYVIVVSTVTVDAQTVTFILGDFIIGYEGAVLDTTIATLASQTSFTLEDGSADNDAYNGCVAVVHDLASAVQVAIGLVLDYVGATKTVTLAVDPAVFTMAAGDNISLFPRVDVAHWAGTVVATPTVAGVPEVDLTHVAGATTNVAALATNVDAILTDTADMQPKLGTPAGVSVSADIAAVKADTGPILVDTGTTLQAELDGIQADTEDIQTRIPAALVGGRMDATIDATGFEDAAVDKVWDEAASGHVTAGTFGQRLQSPDSGTAQAGAATSITLQAGASAVNDFYNDSVVVITGGTGAGQARTITAYNGTTKVATVAAWATNPAVDSVYFIIPAGAIAGASAPTAAQVADAVWDEAQADHVTAGSTGAKLNGAAGHKFEQG